MRVTRRHLAAGALALAALPTIVPTIARAESADKAKLEALVADQLSYGHSGGRIETKKEFVDVVAGKKTTYKSITISEPKVQVTGNNAVARHTYAVEFESDGKPGSAKIGVMQVWVKDGGNWKLLARQAFRTS